MTQKVHLISFADKRFNQSKDRFIKQALSLDCFDSITVFNEDDFSSHFADRFRSKLKKNIRGFGYWCWKPEVLRIQLSRIADNDILIYCDIGCHFNVYGKHRMNDYINTIKFDEKGLIGFEVAVDNYSGSINQKLIPKWNDKMWVKGDLIDYFKLRGNDNLLEAPTFTASVIFVKKTKFAISFVDEWIAVFYENFHLIDDSKSQSLNFEEFVEHRHDQAIFSLLCKIYGVSRLSYFETWHPSKQNRPFDWLELETFPIHAKRDKKMSYINKFIRKIRFVL